MKWLVLIMIFVGEAGIISTEIVGAKWFSELQGSFWQIFFKILPFSIVTGALILSGYILGLKAFQNIWIVTVTSITSILISEPIIIFAITGQKPTLGALIGFVFGIIGLVSALVIK